MIRKDLIQSIFLNNWADFNQSINTEIDCYFQSIKFQSFTKQQIDKLISEISPKKPLSTVLNRYHFPFIYNPQILQQISSIANLKSNTIDLFVLYNYISFIAQFDIDKKLPEYEILLKSLISISFSLSNLGELSAKCFNHLFQIILNINEETNLKTLQQLYCTYASQFSCPKLTILFLKKLINLNKLNEFDDFLNSLCENLKDHPDFFLIHNEDSIENIQIENDYLFMLLEPLVPYIIQFRPSVVHLFSLFESIPEDISPNIFPEFRHNILEEIFRTKPIELPTIKDNQPIYFEIPKNPNVLLGFPDELNTSISFDISQSITFPRLIDLSTLLSQDLIDKLHQVEVLTKYDVKNIEMFISSLFEILHFHEQNPYFYTIIAVILFFSNNLIENSPENFELPTELAISYFHPKIFDASISIFNEKIDFSIFNTFRSICLDCICSDSGDALNQFINIYLINYPYLLAEIFYRFINSTSLLISKLESTPQIIDSFRTILLTYQYFQSVYEKDTVKLDSIITVRVALFALFAHIFASDDIMRQFMNYIPSGTYLSSSNSFINAYLSFFFEDSFRPYVITTIRNFFVNDNDQIQPEEIDSIVSIFITILTKTSSRLPSDPALSIIRDLVNLLNDIILYKNSKIDKHLSFICPILCESLTKLNNNEISKQVCSLSISFFTHMSLYFEITNLEIDAIISCLSVINDSSYFESLYTKLVQLLAGEYLPQITPHFEIRQPQVVKLFILFLFSTPKMQEVLNFIYALLQNSSMNLEKCANCDLDIFILDFLEREKYKETLPVEILQLVLQAYSLLSSRHSTTQSVLRFISLLAPINKSRVSKYESLFFSTFQNIISTVYKTPEFIFPYEDEHTATICLNKPNSLKSFIDTNQLQYGFSLPFWLWAEPSKSLETKTRLIDIYFGNRVRFSLMISNSTLLFSQDDSITESTCAITDTFAMHCWQFSVFTYVFQKVRNAVQVKIESSTEFFTTIPLLKTEPDFNNVQIVLHNLNYTPNQGQMPKRKHQMVTQLGPFGIFPPLEQDDHVLIREIGVRPRMKPSIPYYIFVFNEVGYVQNERNNFVDVFISKCGIDTILPMFRLNVYPNHTDNYEFDFQFEYGFILLTKILLFNQTAQKKFLNIKGFNILLEIIIEYWFDKFDKKFYSQLTSLLQLVSNEKLQIHLFDAILVHFTFLMKLNPVVHEKILLDLSKSTFVSYKSLVRPIYHSGYILSVLRTFYYINPTEAMIVIPSKYRNANLNVQKCRSYLFDILYSFYSDRFEINDFDSLIFHSISCADVDQSYDILQFMLNVFKNIQITFSIETDRFSCLIHYFICHPDSRFHSLIIDMIDLCYLNNLISNDYFIRQMNIIIRNIPDGFITEKFVEYVKGKFERNHLFLSLMCYFSIHLNQTLHSFINSLQYSKSYVSNQFWAIWPLIMTLYSTPEDARKVIMFLIQSDNYNLLDIFGQFDAVFDLYPKQRNIIENHFLTTLCNIDQNVVSQTNYLELSKRILFFGHSDENSDLLIEKPIENNSFNPKIIFDKASPEIKLKPRLSFSVDLALSSLSLFLNNSKQLIEYCLFDLILCAFLHNQESEKVADHLDHLDIQLPESNSNEIVLQLLYYHMFITERSRATEFKNKSSELLKTVFPSYSSVFNYITSPLLNQNKYSILLKELEPKLYLATLQKKVDQLKKFNRNTIQDNEMIETLDRNQFIIESTNQILEVEEKEQQNENDMKNLWNRLFSALTVERAPWYMKWSDENDWKRDTSLVNSIMTPIKMIRNKQLDLIENATKKRDVETIFELKCDYIKTFERIPAFFSLTTTNAYIIFNENTSMSFNIEYLRYIFWVKETSLLFITKQGIQILLDFNNESNKKRVLDFFISQKQIPFIVLQNLPSKQFFPRINFQKKWQEMKLTNYQYLIFLNFLIGRNFIDVSNYPLLPWILKDYNTEQIQLTSNLKSMIRDFSSGINEKQNIEEQNVLAFLKFIEPYHSNCELQSNYNSIDDYLMKSKNELIPEFYSMPEIFENNDFQLPKWATSPIDFVYIHRKILESSAVSSSLHTWITSVYSSELFDGIHPIRSLKTKPPLLDDIYDFKMNISTEIKAAGLANKTGKKTMTLFALTSNGTVYSYRFSYSKRKRTYMITMDSPPKPAMVSKSLSNLASNQVNPISMQTASSPMHLIDTSKNNMVLSENELNSSQQLFSVPDSLNSSDLPEMKSASSLNSSDLNEMKLTSSFNSSDLNEIKSMDDVNELGSKGSDTSSNESKKKKENLEHVKQQTEPILIASKKYGYPEINFDFAHPLQDGKFIVVNKKSRRIALVGFRTVYFETQLNKITCIASDSEWVAIAGDSSVYLYQNTKFFCTIQLYRDLITAVAVSSDFNSVVAGTKDGSIIICSILYGSMVKVIELKKMIPKKVMISPSWGFIVSYCQSIVLGSIKHFILVHSITGILIRQVEIQFEVVEWTCTSERGFDHMLLLSSDETVYHCEVYFMEMHKIFRKRTPKTIAISYSYKSKCAIITKESGDAFFVPLVLK